MPVGNTYAAYIKIEGAENNTHLYSEFVINSEGNIEITCNSWQEEKKNSLQLRGSGTIYEGTTGNDSMSTAIRTYHDYDNYGSLDSMTDEDWWVVSFDYDGIAAFWLGNIPTGCDYDLALWDDTGTARKYAANSGTTAEYMLYEVEADRNYYIQVHGWEGANDPDSMYWFRTKIYPCVEVEVTLHRQEAYNTCGCAAGKMVLGSLGINITETEFYAKNVELNGTQFDYVYAIKNTINYFLSSANKSFRYKYLQTNETTDSAQTILLENLANGYPVEMLIAIYSSNVTDETEYFPYLTNGHYVVLSGLYYDTVTETEMAIVYDSHDVYSDVYEVPLSALLLYNSNRSNYVICVEGE